MTAAPATTTTDWSDYVTFWNVVIFMNALAGLIVFELAWHQFRRFRNPNKDLDALYPAYRRDDAKHWQKWTLYPGAVTIMLPRIIFMLLTCVGLLIWLNILMFGKEKGTPLSGCRKMCLQMIYKITVHLQATIGFFTLVKWTMVNPEAVNHYEEYLGTQAE